MTPFFFTQNNNCVHKIVVAPLTDVIDIQVTIFADTCKVGI